LVGDNGGIFAFLGNEVIIANVDGGIPIVGRLIRLIADGFFDDCRLLTESE
jgi:hypothetical protein